MSKKYRQRGYQDDDRDRPPLVGPREPKGDGRPRRGYGPREPRKVNMPGFHDVRKCARCGASLTEAIQLDSQCAQCSADLHSCAQCTWFDTSSQFECGRPIPKRMSPKDERNDCTYFEARITVERETRSAPPTVETRPASGSGNARQAFDDLFK